MISNDDPQTSSSSHLSFLCNRNCHRTSSELGPVSLGLVSFCVSFCAFGLKVETLCRLCHGTELSSIYSAQSLQPGLQHKAKKTKAQVLGIAPLNTRSTCQRRFTIVEVVTDRHWLTDSGPADAASRHTTPQSTTLGL